VEFALHSDHLGALSEGRRASMTGRIRPSSTQARGFNRSSVLFSDTLPDNRAARIADVGEGIASIRAAA
jgi:hypothetical protein